MAYHQTKGEYRAHIKSCAIFKYFSDCEMVPYSNIRLDGSNDVAL